MAWFTVQYRGPDGKTESVQIESADRAGVFAELKKRGISAVRVEEAKGKVNPKKAAQAKDCRLFTNPKVIVVFLAAIVLALLLYLFFLSSNFGSEKVSQAEVEKREDLSRLRERSGVNQANEKVDEVVAKADKLMKEVAASISNQQQTATNSADAAESPAVKRTKELGVTAVDQLLNMATSAPSDIPPPPLPITSRTEDAFREMLKRPIEIKNSDSPDVRAIKERMLKNRAELLSLLDEGYTVSDVLMQHQEMLTEQSKVRRSVMEGLKEYEDAGDKEGAELYLKVMNEKLVEIGYEPIYGSTPFKGRQARNRIKHVQEEQK